VVPFALLALLVAWLAGALAAVITPAAAGILGLAAGLVLGWLATGNERIGLAVAFLPAVLLHGTGLVPASGSYLPSLVVAGALAAATLPGLIRRPGSTILPPRPMLAAAAAYLGWFAAATLASIAPRTSATYLVGAAGTLAIVLVLMPTVLCTSRARQALLVTLAVAGPALVLIGLLLALTGPLTVFGDAIGSYVPLQLTWLGGETPVVLLRISGPYFTPGYDAIALSIAVLALLALDEVATRGWRLPVRLALVVTFVGLLLTFDRDGLLAVIVGASIHAVLRLWHGRGLGVPFATAVAAAVIFVAVLGNALGATLAPPPGSAAAGAGGFGSAATSGSQAGVTTGRQPSETDDELPVRGGTSLSGRGELWSASAAAIRADPVLGSGPGTDAQAIAPYLTGQSRRFLGLTSHDTWLRTAVELGLPGLLLLLLFLGSAVPPAWRLARRRTPDPFHVGLLSVLGGLTAAFTFETFLLGGLSYASVIWPLAAAILAVDLRVRRSMPDASGLGSILPRAA
jgi:hypothetical protein